MTDTEQWTKSTLALTNAIKEVWKEIEFIEFDSNNPQYGKKGSNYASSAGIIRQFHSAFTKHGIVLGVEEKEGYPRVETHVLPSGKIRTDAVSCIVLNMTLDGLSFARTEGCGSGSDYGDKAVMKARTAAYKYALAHGFCLGWAAEDPEADVSMNDTPAQGKPQQPTKHTTEKVSPPTTSSSELKLSLESAKTYEALEALKPTLMNYRRADKEGYKALLDVYKERKKVLRSEGDESAT